MATRLSWVCHGRPAAYDFSDSIGPLKTWGWAWGRGKENMTNHLTLIIPSFSTGQKKKSSNLNQRLVDEEYGINFKHREGYSRW